MINDNSWYIAMHLDRLNEELIEDTYGKQVKDEKQKKKQKTKPDIEINSPADEKIQEDLKD